MKIVVCVKQVPAAGDAKIDPETKRILREGLKSIMNPFDVYALEEAVRLRESHGGEVIAVSMGPPKAEFCLREAISVGADGAVLLSDSAFGGSDTWATSYVLAKAVEKIGNVDLILCGKQAVDGDTAQVGPGIAAHLNWVQAAYVTGVEYDGSKLIRVKRTREGGYDICEIRLPAVLTVVKDINTPRVPTLKGCIASRKVGIPVWKPGDIGADMDKIGLNGSPTRVVKTMPPSPRNKETARIEGSPSDCAERLALELKERGVLQK